MSNDHVGIPKKVMLNFAHKNHVFCYDFARNKDYPSHVENIGAEHNYYDDDVEKGILANDVERKYAPFVDKFASSASFENYDYLNELVNQNREIITRMFSFMYMRAKKTLEQMNEETIIGKAIGGFTHSELLRVIYDMKMDIIGMLGDEYDFYPMIVFGQNDELINNSLGFTIMSLQNVSFFIPICTKGGILLTQSQKYKRKQLFFSDSLSVDKMNKSLATFEKAWGNGFVFGRRKKDVYKAVEHIVDKEIINNHAEE